MNGNINYNISSNELLVSAKNKWVIKPWKDVEEPYMHITKWEKIWKGYLWHGSNYMTFYKSQIYGDSKKISGFQGFRRKKGIYKQSIKDFLWQWNHFVWYYHGRSMPTGCTIPRVNPNVDYELWVIMTCQCRFINGNKYTVLVVHVDNEVGAVPLWGQGVYGRS